MRLIRLLFLLLLHPTPPPSISVDTIIILIILCVICVLPCHRPFSLLLQNGEHGVFNARSDLSMCFAHEGEKDTEESAQVLTGKTEKRPFTLSCPVVELWPVHAFNVQRTNQPTTNSCQKATKHLLCAHEKMLAISQWYTITK